ncbi:hypothetical protein CPB86DRAFT_58196 [Serendipita vermifera]|nr:hypothetical protein CPB86DRAFT_58196 [Serendipita vermifera]
MTLRLVNLDSTTLFTEKPRSLPSLVYLSLESGSIQGSLQMYFRTPKIEDLSFKKVKFYPLKDDARHEVKVNGDISSQLLLDTLDCEIYANLKTLSLSRMNIPKNFVMKIRSYVELWRLDMSESAIEDFVPSFVAHLEDLPSLREIHISLSWPYLMLMSFKEFVEQCAVKRPRMNIFLRSSGGIS